MTTPAVGSGNNLLSCRYVSVESARAKTELAVFCGSPLYENVVVCVQPCCNVVTQREWVISCKYLDQG